jgi:small subunit ribosomal protein S10e
VYLNLPSEIVPATLKKSAQPSRPAFGGRPEGGAPRDGARAGGYGDRDGYRGALPFHGGF